MKILKKLLLVGLCSFAFCVSANAEVILPEFPFDVENTSYIVEYNQQVKYVYVGYCKGTNYSLGSTSTYSSISSTVYGFRYCIDENGDISEMYRRRIDAPQIESDIYNDTVDLSSYSWTSEERGASYSISLYYVEELERLQILKDGQIASQEIYNRPIIDANMDVYLRTSDTPYGIKVFDKSVLDAPIEENVCDRTAVLGVVSNVSDITLNVKGETSALAEPLKGTFTLNYSKDYAFTSDDFVIEFVNNSEVGVVGNYNFKCDEVSYNCYLNYEYNTEDDITETANFSFKISMANNNVIPFIKIYACTTNDDYTYISYDYTNGPSDSTTSNPSLDNYLNDLTPPSSDISGLGNIQGILPEGPVDGLLNIPFKVISILIDGFNGTCKPISFRFVFDMPLTFPCVGDELYNHMDSTLMLFVNIVPTAFILIKWFKNLYVRVQRATSLETTTDDEWGGI